MGSLEVDEGDVEEAENHPHKFLQEMIRYLNQGTPQNNSFDFREPQLRYAFTTLYPLFVFLYALIVAVGLFSNCLMIYAIFRDRLYKDQTYCYFVNLALSDIVKCVLVLPVSLMVLLIQNWIFGSFLCYFLPMMQVRWLSITTVLFCVVSSSFLIHV